MQTNDQNEAFEYEKYLIVLYHSNDREYGYNISSGGEAGAKGVTWSDERKKSYSEKYRGENHPLFGKKMSEEQKKKLRELA